MAKEKFSFKYKKLDEKKADRRMKEKGGAYDNYTKPEFPQWKPKSGENKIRVIPCPKALETDEHYGKTIHLHYGIGPDEASYLSLKEHLKKPDPIAEERVEANRDGNEEYAKKLRPGKRVLLWIIDRKEADKGPQLFSCPFTLDQDILRAAKDEGGGLLHHYDPDDGYDVIFNREGEKKNTKYNGVKLARKSTPLSDDEDQQTEWLKYVVENPLEDTLQFYDYDHISDVFAGGKASDKKKKGDDEEEGEDKPTTRAKKRVRMTEDDEEEEKPKGKKKVDLDDDDEDETPKSKKKKPDPDDDDEDETPKSKKKKPADDEDEDEEDEAPKSKSKKKPDPDEDEDDEDEVPKSKSKGKKKPADEDDEDEDEDDQPPAKSKKKKPADEDDEDEEEEEKPKSKGKKKPVDEDDEDDEDEDEAPKSKKKKRPVDEDDDDD